MLRKADVFLLLTAVFCIMILFLVLNGGSRGIASWNDNGVRDRSRLIAVIKKDNIIIDRIDLSQIEERKIIQVTGQYSASIAMEHNRICFLESTCPDKACEKTRWLSKPGDFAVCLPNKTSIKLQK